MKPEYRVHVAYMARRGTDERPIDEINKDILDRFGVLVSESLAAGWQLAGGVSLTRDTRGCVTIAQAIIRYGEADHEIPY